MAVNLCNSMYFFQPANIDGEDNEQVTSYKYLGVHLDWSVNTHGLYKKVDSRVDSFSSRRLKSFGVCTDMLYMFYCSVVASALFYATVCWGNSITDKKEGRAGRPVTGGLVVQSPLEQPTFSSCCVVNTFSAEVDKFYSILSYTRMDLCGKI